MLFQCIDHLILLNLELFLESLFVCILSIIQWGYQWVVDLVRGGVKINLRG